jgi:UDP-N-acetylglucosamine:LPS N-acetylglucosamine transferase
VKKKTKTILAVSSGGGHWIELLRLRPAFNEHHVEYVTVRSDYRDDVQGSPFHQVNDATGWNYLGSFQLLLRMVFILLKVRPDVVVSTGAAPGYFAIRVGKLLGAKTIWVDSLANVEELSRAGRMAGPHADLWLTQWPKLATDQGPHFAGQVL